MLAVRAQLCMMVEFNHASSNPKPLLGNKMCWWWWFMCWGGGIPQSVEWSPKPACPSLIAVLTGGDTEGTNSSKILCLMFVCFVWCKG